MGQPPYPALGGAFSFRRSTALDYRKQVTWATHFVQPCPAGLHLLSSNIPPPQIGQRLPRKATNTPSRMK